MIITILEIEIFIGLLILQRFLIKKNKKLLGLVLLLTGLLSSLYFILPTIFNTYRLSQVKSTIGLGALGPWMIILLLVIIPIIILAWMYVRYSRKGK